MTTDRMRVIRIKANEFRQNCKVIKYGIANIFDECDKCGFRLVRYPIGSDGVLGFSQIRDEDRIIFSNSSARLAREIFTVAHEVGHILLHLSSSGVYVDDAHTLSGSIVDEHEKEANYFAACLLMPEEEVSKYIAMELDTSRDWNSLDIARMMTVFNVSFDMALNRLQNLGKIDKRTRARLDSEKNQNRVTRLLQMTGENSRLNYSSNVRRIPSSYMDWVVYNYNHGVIPRETLEKSLQYFDITMDDISDALHPINHDIEEDIETLIGGIDD